MYDDFSIHDVADFPLVRFRADRASEGFASTWMTAMGTLVAGGPFALLIESMATGESTEDFKRRGLWLKVNHERLARACRVLVTEIPGRRAA